jgi:hypothetical protein
MDLHQAIQDQPFLAMTIGSEFQLATILELLLHYHPVWNRFRRWLTDGITYPLAPISEEDCLTDLHTNIQRGNHKSVIMNSDHLHQML